MKTRSMNRVIPWFRTLSKQSGSASKVGFPRGLVDKQGWGGVVAAHGSFDLPRAWASEKYRRNVATWGSFVEVMHLDVNYRLMLSVLFAD
jgi:hypothetical protein